MDTTAVNPVQSLAGVLDPTAAAKQPGALGKEEFLTLLIKQLENQDPLEPMENSEFVAQLATFSSLEQLLAANDKLEMLAAGQVNLVNAQALNLIGKVALVAGNGEITVKAGVPDTLAYSLPNEAASAKITVYNADGVPVKVLTLDPKATGRATVDWDGTGDDGKPLPDGTYRVEASATDASGNTLEVSLFRALSIDSVSFDGGIISLISGDQEIPFDRIVEIRAGRS